jgi:hypothetical protein
MQLPRPRATLPAGLTAPRLSSDDTGGWLFQVINPMLPSTALFRSRRGSEDARQLLQAHPDVGDDKIEAVGPVSIPNMLVFDVKAGEVQQIDRLFLGAIVRRTGRSPVDSRRAIPLNRRVTRGGRRNDLAPAFSLGRGLSFSGAACTSNDRCFGSC